MKRQLGLWVWIACLAGSVLTGCKESDEEPFIRKTDAGQGSGDKDKPDAGDGIVAPVVDEPECSNEIPCPAADGMCQENVCVEGKCQQQAVTDGASCNDAVNCTVEDSCTAGICGGKPLVCDDGLLCSIDSCNEAMGGCVANMDTCACRKDTDCQDDNPCNGIEICNFDTNRCAKGTVVNCSGLDSACNTGQCDAMDGTCNAVPRPKGTACDDKNSCTRVDACDNGVCIGAMPVACAPQSQCHIAGSCNPANGTCTNPLKANGVMCNDGNACTQGEACKAGVCSDGVATVCVARSECHNVGTCNTTTGICATPTKANGTSCNDGFTCSQTDVCTAGTCMGAAVTCDDKIACTQDSCSETQGGCTADPSACACTRNVDCDDGNACNGVETCDMGSLTCKKGTVLSCTNLTNDCQVGACNPSTGACYALARPNGIACDDGNACTRTDSCQTGQCQGANPIVCAASDQCHVAGACNPGTGMCSNPNATNGTACDDADACSQTDTCQAGACTGGNPVICAALDQCHAVGACNSSTGQCSNPEKANGSTCDDANACTQTDSCQAGTCSGSNNVICRALDQCHVAGICNTGTGVCTDPLEADGSTCNDGDACTQTDTCQTGSCVGANPKVCAALDQCHVAGVCNPTDGVCSNPNQANGVSCSDADACTQTDTCQTGSCVGGNPKVCTALDQCHVAGMCNPTNGVCSNPNKNDGTACDDALVCTQTDVCTGGACSGSAINCNDNIACTQDSCSEQQSGCVNNTAMCGCTRDADCNDSNACNGVETCNLGNLTCVAGTPVNCAGSDDACNLGTCNQASGACEKTPRASGTTCNDGDACTQTDTCQTGTCTGANQVVCTALDQCHVAGMCNPTNGVCSNPNKNNGTACSDGDACTQTDTCQSGACSGGNPVACTPQSQCHVAGTCNPGTGVCSNPTQDDGTACSDGNACTQTDTCQTGTCNGANPKTCTASDQCHNAGTCDTGSGACSNPNKNDGTTCNDANACTQTDTCQTGTCTGASPVTCAALDQCHDIGTCDTGTGLCSDPNKTDNTTCNDNDGCTLTDTCQTGACTGSNPKSCSALDQCHDAGTCNPANGLCSDPNKPDATTCNDGDLCTLTDTCQTGVCTGNNPKSCTAVSQCHDAGTCNPTNGVCSTPPKANNTTCDDGDMCSQTDTCQSGTCTGGYGVICTALDQCHDVGTCNPGTGACDDPNKTNGVACNDSNACTQTDTCQGGACSGGNPVACTAQSQCHNAGTCSAGTCSNPYRTGSCDDNKTCTLNDMCNSGTCGGTDRRNASNDWNTTPDSRGNGVFSVHSDVIELDGTKGLIAQAGAFTGTVDFSAADSLSVTAPDVGAYFVVYNELTKDILRKMTVILAQVDNQSETNGALDVRDLAVAPDNSFILVGTAAGDLTFGIAGGAQKAVITTVTRGFVVRFDAMGNVVWLRLLSSQDFVQPRTTDVFVSDGTTVENNSVIVGGLVSTGLIVENDAMEALVTLSGTGTFATYFEKDGTHKFSDLVADQPLGRLEVAADGETGLAGFVGTFSQSVMAMDASGTKMTFAAAGSDGDVDILVIAFAAAQKLIWGRGIGGTENDQVGGIIPYRGFPVFVGVRGNAGRVIDDQAKTEDLAAVSGTALQAYLIAFSETGAARGSAMVGDADSDVGAHDLTVDPATGDITTLGWFNDKDATTYHDVPLTGNAPGNPGVSLTNGTDRGTNLFSARFGYYKTSEWAVWLRGVNAGIRSTTDWDAQIVVHPSESASATGMFSATRDFGDKVVDALTPAGGSSFFLSHYNSQAEYDYCP